MTLGLDGFWRASAARTAAAAGGRRWLDVCSGTGDMAGELAALAPQGASICAADFSPEMIAGARSRPGMERVEFVLAGAGALPFGDGTFDLLTMSFATRNVQTGTGDLAAAFREFSRVLVPGGRLVTLETSQPPNALVRACFHLFTRTWVAPVGSLVSGSREAYAYLAGSMRAFHGAEELAGVIRGAGFARVEYRRMCFGAVAVHSAVKS
jgi:demethylmenaquinone methyltransferase/2-methoxy-6-polyprenyl-1,4-benzoquinol methylase